MNARGSYFENLYLTQVSDCSYSITEITTGNNAQYDDDFNVSFNINPITPVPEADTYALMLAGLGLMSLVSRRKAK